MKNAILRARSAVFISVASAALPLAAQTSTVGTLAPVVVTANRFSEPADVLPYGVSVITASDIRKAGVSSVSEAVMKLLGVYGRLDLSGGNNYSLDLRGFGSTSESNQVVVVDGRRLNEADQSSTGFSAIPIESVERIEVIRGAGGAVLYGEGATGGVIVITTKAGKGVERRNAAQVSGAVGSYGLRDVRASSVLASGGFSLDVNADERRSDGHRDNFSSLSNNLAATGQWSNEWLRLGVLGGRGMLQSGLPGDLTAAQYAADPSQAKNMVDYGAVKSENTGVFADATLGDWQLGLDINQRTKKYASFSFGSPYAYDVDASNANLRARHEAKFASYANVLITGLDSNRWERTIRQSAFTAMGTVAKSEASAFYLADDLTYVPFGTRLSLGWRSEQLTKSEASSVTRLDDRQNAWHAGVSQPLAQEVTAYARLGQSYRLANVDEFSFTNPGVAIQAQTSRDQELGVRWSHQATRMELRWYRSDLRNEIGYDPSGTGPFGPFGANINFDPTRRQGIEVEVRHLIRSDVDLRINAASRQAQFTDGAYAGRDVALVPRQTVAVGAGWRPAAGHSVDMGVNWVSSQYVDFDNVCSIPAYSTVDARYAYAMGNVEFALGVKNLGDRKYFTQAFTCTAGVVGGIYPEAGRSVSASVQVKF
ncbi:MAG: TonB-dependent receptor [Burkholderiales bacterium]|nr:TonB-dependent receptor [Burkholderiales bacterium]